MEANPIFFRDLAYVFLAAIIGGAFAWKLRQPIILGYVVAGILIGPFTPGPTVTHVHTIELFAEIGVILLMFSVGLEFSLKELLRAKWVALVGGPIGILLSIGAGLLIGRLLGWPTAQGIVVGSVISVASTMVLTRMLIDRGELNTEYGRVMVAITLVEDLAVVFLVVLLPNLANLNANRFITLSYALGKAALLLLPLLLIAAKIVPPLLRTVARTRSPELFFGIVLAICLGTAALTQAFGLSLALGAFAAGMMISESAYAHEVLAQLFPLRDSFVALFFVAMGLLVDPKTLFSNPLLLATMVGLILFGKFLIWTIVVRLFRYPIWTALLVGTGLTQIGEFSFILVQVARTAGLVGAEVYNATLAASLATILVNAALFRYVPNWIARARLSEQGTKQENVPQPKLDNHVVLCGFGKVGGEVGSALDVFQVSYTVIETDPDIVERLRKRGVPCIYGDATRRSILLEANIQNARIAILTLPEGTKNQQIIRNIRGHSPDVFIMARAHSSSEYGTLFDAGASDIIQPEFEASATVIRRALEYLHLPPDQVLTYLRRLRAAIGSGQVESHGTTLSLPNVFEFELDTPGSVSQSLRDSQIRERFGVTVVAVRRHSGELVLNPPPETILESGDHVRVFGLQDQIARLTPVEGFRRSSL